MKKIASFTINHDSLTRGMYVSRVDGDVVTYDIRMKTPNNPENDYLEDNALHTFEHLFATYVRNTPYSDEIVYVGPMGCRTGFYFLTRDTLPKETAIVWCRRPFPMCCSSREKFRAANGGNAAIILPTTWQVQKKLHRKFSRF